LRRITEDRLDPQVERRQLAVGKAIEETGRVLERGLLVMVERGQHAQRGQRRIGIGPPALAARAFDATIEEVAQRLVETFEPFASLVAKGLDLAIGNVTVRLEQIIGLLEGRAHHVEELQPVLGETRAQHRTPFVRAHVGCAVARHDGRTAQGSDGSHGRDSTAPRGLGANANRLAVTLHRTNVFIACSWTAMRPHASVATKAVHRMHRDVQRDVLRCALDSAPRGRT
jgi:hypothetical protein